jgi:hypothetical protein
MYVLRTFKGSIEMSGGDEVVADFVNKKYRGLAKALWAVAGALLVAAGTIFGAGVYWLM